MKISPELKVSLRHSHLNVLMLYVLGSSTFKDACMRLQSDLNDIGYLTIAVYLLFPECTQPGSLYLLLKTT